MRSIGYPPKDTTRRDPEVVARMVNARAIAARTLAHYREPATRPRDRVDETDRDIERIAAVLADFAERLLAVEQLADYAAERTEQA